MPTLCYATSVLCLTVHGITGGKVEGWNRHACMTLQKLTINRCRYRFVLDSKKLQGPSITWARHELRQLPANQRLSVPVLGKCGRSELLILLRWWWCSYEDLHKVDQPQHAHSSEVRLGVVSLESNVPPLFGDPGLQLGARHQQLPQLRRQIILNLYNWSVVVLLTIQGRFITLPVYIFCQIYRVLVMSVFYLSPNFVWVKNKNTHKQI